VLTIGEGQPRAAADPAKLKSKALAEQAAQGEAQG
jgi:hypothetical protein